ncbi:putative phospholipase D [Dioscorea sansibarensis]
MSLDQCSYVKMPSEPPVSGAGSFRLSDLARIFDELPKATIISVSEPDASDITPFLLTYTIEFQYKQFKWRLLKKASQVLYLHFALKKRVLIDEIHQNKEQVKEWLQNIGLVEHAAVMQEDDDVYAHPPQHEENFSARNRNIPSRAALPIMRPALGRQQSISDRAKLAMQRYLNHFLGNLDIVNSREVCKFLEVSRLSFSSEYGPKLKEDYVTAQHIRNVRKKDAGRCCPCHFFGCCNGKGRKVWAVLKPGFLALLEDPFDTKLLDIVIFDRLPSSVGNGVDSFLIAKETKGRNPLHCGFLVSCGNRTIKLTTRNANAKDWVSAINSATQWSPEGWCHPQRYGSFAPSRGLTEDGSMVQWFIDGEAAFDAIASSIEEAKSEIFITDWWLCPELYLRRPFQVHGSSRLDLLLQTKAKQGVQIYILLYKEVALALKINSTYSERRLVNLHENVKVLRFPDHLSSGIYLWSHHEKIVIVDHGICYIGGLDLCFGRYDTPEHNLGDFPSMLWPGKDYYNPRESEPNSWEDMMRDELDRRKYPRMPWHDVQCAIWGPACRDVARHFVQRWNYAKRNKAPDEQSIPLLMPQQHMVIPHYMGKDWQMNGENKCINHNSEKHDLFSPSSLQDIPLLLPRDPDAQRIVSGDHKCMDKDWREKQEQRGSHSVDEIGQVGPRLPCHCQIIRSVGQWSAGTCQTEESIHKAYISLIEKAEYFIYIENQFFISGFLGDDVIQNRLLEALYKRILRAVNEKKCFRVIIVIPLLPGFQGGLDDSGAASVRALVHWQYRTITRGPNSILQRLHDVMGPKANDYISFYGLRTYGRLCDGGPVVTNQVYVHSKLMIVDDRIVLLGSANINDRSLLGSRDSEIGIVIEDKVFVASFMDGNPWKAGGFALSLRLSLWSEHIGLHGEEVSNWIRSMFPSLIVSF